MLAIEKDIMPMVKMTDGEEVINNEVFSIITCSEELILSYDTDYKIVYHTKEEITDAFNSLFKTMKDNYKTAYEERNQELHDCMAELQSVVKLIQFSLNNQSIKYFLSFSDYIEELLINYSKGI